MKTLWMFVLALWEMPRQMFMCIATPSDEWQIIQDAKMYEEIREMCPNGAEAFEINLKAEDFK